MRRLARIATVAAVAVLAAGLLVVAAPPASAIIYTTRLPACVKLDMPTNAQTFIDPGVGRVQASRVVGMAESPCNDINVLDLRSTFDPRQTCIPIRVRYFIFGTPNTVTTPFRTVCGRGVVYRNGAAGWHEQADWAFRFEVLIGNMPGIWNATGMF